MVHLPSWRAATERALLHPRGHRLRASNLSFRTGSKERLRRGRSMTFSTISWRPRRILRNYLDSTIKGETRVFATPICRLCSTTGDTWLAGRLHTHKWFASCSTRNERESSEDLLPSLLLLSVFAMPHSPTGCRKGVVNRLITLNNYRCSWDYNTANSVAEQRETPEKLHGYQVFVSLEGSYQTHLAFCEVGLRATQ